MEPGGRIASLQILRFAAALGVVVMHVARFVRVVAWNDHAAPYFATDIGAAGVDVFFVLSGFVITLTGPLASPRPSGRAFFWRRFTRVAPTFWLFSLAFVALAAEGGALNWPQTLATFAFWPVAGHEAVTPYLQPGWTLCFEMVFYSAVAACLAGGRLRRNLALLAAVIAVLMALRAVFPGRVDLRWLVSPMFVEFGFGAGLAIAAPRLRGLPSIVGAMLIAAGLAILAILAAVGFGHAADWQSVLIGDAWPRVMLFGLPGAAIVAGALICDRVVRGPLAHALAWLGDASYSLYLTQSFTVAFGVEAWALTIGPRWPWAMALTAIAGCVAFSAWSYARVEQPLLRAVRSLRVQRQQAASVVAGAAARH